MKKDTCLKVRKKDIAAFKKDLKKNLKRDDGKVKNGDR